MLVFPAVGHQCPLGAVLRPHVTETCVPVCGHVCFSETPAPVAGVPHVSMWEVVEQVSDPCGCWAMLLALLWRGVSAWLPEAGAPRWATLEGGAFVFPQSHAESGFVPTSSHGLTRPCRCPVPGPG